MHKLRTRLRGKEVRIRRHGNVVILEPIAESWAWLDTISGIPDEDFIEAVNEQSRVQERPKCDVTTTPTKPILQHA